ncbi:helix-turn-helix domain-containing protein [Reticulibacter mediterranei]|uniref:helix-turn-helix domain-containing protein n=1 Tax=Reticulibacter mediterranei TaxID=2778369 RepID=UPI001C68B29A
MSESLPYFESIRLARRKKGWSQRELAKQLRVGETTIRAWEKGRHRPSLALQPSLESVLGISLCQDTSCLS